MTTRERARLRRECLEYARAYLGLEKLPSGIKVIARAYADGFSTYPRPGWGDPMFGLGRQLDRFRKPWSGL